MWNSPNFALSKRLIEPLVTGNSVKEAFPLALNVPHALLVAEAVTPTSCLTSGMLTLKKGNDEFEVLDMEGFKYLGAKAFVSNNL